MHLYIHVSHVDNSNIKIEADHVCDYITDNALGRERLFLVLVSYEKHFRDYSFSTLLYLKVDISSFLYIYL